MSTTAKASTNEQRNRFEAWANAKGTMGQSWNGGYYENPLHEAAWQAWQAAEQRVEELEEALRGFVGFFRGGYAQAITGSYGQTLDHLVRKAEAALLRAMSGEMRERTTKN